MNTEKELSEYIEKYLSNELNDVERGIFEFRQSANADFAEKVKAHKVVHELIIDQGLIELKQKIQAGNYTNQTKNHWKAYAIGGSLLLISLLSAYYYADNSRIKPVDQKHSVPSQNNIDSPNLKPIEKPDSKDKDGLDVLKEDKLVPPGVLIKDTTPNGKNEIITQLEDTVYTFVKTPYSLRDEVEVKSSETKKETFKQAGEKTTIHSFQLGDTLIPPKASTSEYQFSPSLGQVWNFPIGEGEDCEIKIMSKSGTIVFQAPVSNGYPNSWNGITSQGTEAAMEAYLYLITYPDGKLDKGYVTIIR